MIRMSNLDAKLQPHDTLKCPECQQHNTVDFWDSSTKTEAGILPGRAYASCAEGISKHEDVDSYYYCPICNSEVSGTDLRRANA